MPVIRQKYLWPAAFLIPMLAGCEREIDFKYHDIPPITVIEGVLTPEGIQVGLTLTTPMDEPMNRTLLQADAVRLLDLDDDTFHDLPRDDEGYYRLSVHGIPEHRYRLEVKKDGCLFHSETEMYGAVDILSAEFAWIKMPYDDVAVLQVLYTDNPDVEDECYWVKVYRNGKIYLWNVQSDRTADNGVMTFFAMTSRRDTDAEDESDVLYEGDEVKIEILPVSRAMHDYLEALGNDSSGPLLFSTVATDEDNKNGNNFCLGYFMATTPVSTTLIYHPDDIQYARN